MNTSDCTYCCNRTRSPVSQSNERKAAPREIKKPHMSDLTRSLVTVPPPAIYILLKNSPCSLNVQVELTSLTSLASISTSAVNGIKWYCTQIQYEMRPSLEGSSSLIL